MNEDFWPEKRLLIMNLETVGEVAMFRALMERRITTETPLVGMVMTADIQLAHEVEP